MCINYSKQKRWEENKEEFKIRQQIKIELEKRRRSNT